MGVREQFDRILVPDSDRFAPEIWMRLEPWIREELHAKIVALIRVHKTPEAVCAAQAYIAALEAVLLKAEQLSKER